MGKTNINANTNIEKEEIMKAKEMFEKLGYEQEEIDEQLIYTKTNVSIDVEYIIIFYLDEKTFEATTDNFAYANDINIKELQAINKQIDELGWK